MEAQKFCLKWDGFQSSVTSVFDHLRQDEELVDITLCCEGQRVKAHRMILSACSPYFRDLLKNNPCQQMVIFLKDTYAADLHSVIEFMYKGSVNVSQNQLASFIKTAEMLQIRGLSGDDDKVCPGSAEDSLADRAAAPPSKRRRRSGSPLLSVPAPAPAPVSRPSRPATDADHSPPPPPPPPAAPALDDRPPPPPPPPAVPPTGPVKIEKVDLTEEDDDVALDATLGYVAEHEGGGYGEPPDLSAVAMVDAAAAIGLVPPRLQPAGEDGATQDGATFSCPICGRQYTNPRSLEYHKKMHEGLTTCVLCGKISSKVEHLRRHLENVHKLSQEDIRSIVPTRHRTRYPAGV